MEVRVRKCEWCGKNYAIKDSSASDRLSYCSNGCEDERETLQWECLNASCEIDRVWRTYLFEYKPSADEIHPTEGEDSPFYCVHISDKQQCLAFLKRYNKWKHNHCWKKDFWAWDPDTDDSSENDTCDESSENDTCDESEGGWGAATVGLIVVGGAIWLIWKIIKTVWNWLF